MRRNRLENALSPLSAGLQVPLWGQTSQFPSNLSPKRDCGTKSTQLIVVGDALLAISVGPMPRYIGG